MPVNEGRMELGDWSVTLRKDTPLALRELLWRWWSHIVITPAWLDPTQLSDAALLAAARYSGVAHQVGPQRRLSGVSPIWWLGDPNKISSNFVGLAFSADPYEDVYEDLLGGMLPPGTFTTGGSYSVQRIDSNLRQAIDRVIQATGHEWRVNPDFTFDAGERDDIYGTTPTVVIVEGGGGRDLNLIGIDAEIHVDGPDYSDWVQSLNVYDQGGYGGTYNGSNAASRTPVGESVYAWVTNLDLPEAPNGTGASIANLLGPDYNKPRYEITVDVLDEGVTECVRAGDLIWVYDEIEGVRDFANQVTYGGRTIWPKLMRVERMSWPVRQGMGVYWREFGISTPLTYYDLTPYVEWETGNVTLELVDGRKRNNYWNHSLLSGARTDAVGAAKDRVYASPWTQYAPTLGGTGTAIGNGIVLGNWQRFGTTLHVGGSLTIGTTTTVGTGAWTISLPSGFTAASYQTQTGTASANDNAVARYPVGTVVLASGTEIYFMPAAGGGFIPGAGSTPFAWAAADTLEWSMTIELDI